MKTIFDIEVSQFKNYFDPFPQKNISLHEWLMTDRYKTKVEAVRKEKNKGARDKLKATLPAITPCGIFAPTRASENIQEHSGFIGIDIDHKENQHIKQLISYKRKIADVPNVAYCGVSVSGAGLFVLIPIQSVEVHNAAFDVLKAYFLKKFNIIVDKACKDIARLRGASYDPNAYINANAQPFYTRFTENKRSFTSNNSTTDNTTVNRILDAVLSTKTDITDGYKNWFEVGCALASAFGENGRDTFHKFSQFNSEYNEADCDRKYDNILKNGGYGFNLYPLIRLAKEYDLWDS